MVPAQGRLPSLRPRPALCCPPPGTSACSWWTRWRPWAGPPSTWTSRVSACPHPSLSVGPEGQKSSPVSRALCRGLHVRQPHTGPGLHRPPGTHQLLPGLDTLHTDHTPCPSWATGLGQAQGERQGGRDAAGPASCFSPGDLPDPGIEPRSSALQRDSLPLEPPGMPHRDFKVMSVFYF